MGEYGDWARKRTIEQAAEEAEKEQGVRDEERGNQLEGERREQEIAERRQRFENELVPAAEKVQEIIIEATRDEVGNAKVHEFYQDHDTNNGTYSQLSSIRVGVRFGDKFRLTEEEQRLVDGGGAGRFKKRPQTIVAEDYGDVSIKLEFRDGGITLEGLNEDPSDIYEDIYDQIENFDARKTRHSYRFNNAPRGRGEAYISSKLTAQEDRDW